MTDLRLIYEYCRIVRLQPGVCQGSNSEGTRGGGRGDGGGVPGFRPSRGCAGKKPGSVPLIMAGDSDSTNDWRGQTPVTLPLFATSHGTQGSRCSSFAAVNVSVAAARPALPPMLTVLICPGRKS